MGRRVLLTLALVFVGLSVQPVAGPTSGITEKASVVFGFSRAPGGLPAAPTTSDYRAFRNFLGRLGQQQPRHRALRRLEAASSKLNEAAWLEAWTEYDPAAGFRYQVVGWGGSDRIRDRVLRKVLETEGENAELKWEKSSLSLENYAFDIEGTTADGRIRVALNPRRRDSRLVDGSILLAGSGTLLSMQGRLSKSPSFWVKWVEVSRRYSPVAGVVMPISVESVADVKIAGLSRFTMQYEYEMVNGENVQVGSLK